MLSKRGHARGEETLPSGRPARATCERVDVRDGAGRDLVGIRFGYGARGENVMRLETVEETVTERARACVRIEIGLMLR